MTVEQVQQETTKTEAPKPEPGTGHARQTFLVGETVYLRPVEKDDAKHSVAIRNSVYPYSPQRTEEWIKDEVGATDPAKSQFWVIRRKADDVIIGSVKVEHSQEMETGLESRVDPLLGDAGQRMRAEALDLMRHHFLDEVGRPTVLAFFPGSESVVLDALTHAGWVETSRHREMRLVNGERVDRVLMQAFNQGWLRVLGDPMQIPLERTGTGKPRPVPPPVGPMPDPPKNALLVGKRVYLSARDIKASAEEEVRWSRQETETFFDIGRHLPPSTAIQAWLNDNEKKDPPETLIIGVHLRENDLYIGCVMLLGLDLVNRTAETGSFFHRADYRGSGYGSEAKQLLLEYAFDVLGLHMVESWVLFPNTRSAAALRKQGYREAGRMCWVYPYEGGFNNGILFDLLADEWRAMPRQEWE
jgi:RimJ/RimL family protein N-acetyltransferase